MDQDRRRTAVAALIELASSDDYLDRAHAGRSLANFAESSEAQESLLRLVLDAGDTFVTRATAEALLRRQDTTGFAIVAEALVSADAQQSTYIHDAATAVFTLFASERDEALAICDALSRNASPPSRQGINTLHNLLTEITPVLFPQSPS